MDAANPSQPGTGSNDDLQETAEADLDPAKAAPALPPRGDPADVIAPTVASPSAKKSSTAMTDLPSKEELDAIAARQDAKRQEILARKSQDQQDEEEAAAQMIQRNYRGYRERRQLNGLGLDASTRWLEAIKEARYRKATLPRSRREQSPTEKRSLSPGDRARRSSSAAKQNWRRIGEIARRAGGDDASDDSSDDDKGLTPEQREERRAKKIEAKREREKTAKMMDLQYFLEMVDQKHRYGSNLRAYHSEWKKADTNENFFYWLDHGEGKNVEVPTCSRERLEKEQVRYLSREERMNYLVKIDSEGRLCWAKNGERISTTIEFKDSVDGIVPSTDGTPAYRDAQGTLHRANVSSSFSSSSSSSSGSIFSSSNNPEAEHYVNHDLQHAKGVKKIKHVSAAAVLNHLLRRSVKPNSWIFVADTSFRLYVGIKQSGAFQHSSFLHGARISAAGLIKIKDGQLRRLSPLSGHYRPPTANFRAFVHALRDEGVDMSRVSISRSYAMLVGLEMYVKTRKKLKHGVERIEHEKDKVLHPEEVKKREERERDKSKSAEKEREILASQQKREEESRRAASWRSKMMRKFGFGSPGEKKDVGGVDKAKGLGQDAESAIPPEGKR